MTTSLSEPLHAASLHRSDPRPLHEQISAAIRERIESGAWPANYQLHAEPRLAEELSVSRGTIRRAIRTLIEDGLLIQIHGKGTFVRPGQAEPALAQEMLSLSEAFEREGITLTTEVMEQGLVAPPDRIGRFLDLEAPNEPVLRLLRRRGDGSRWLALFENYVRHDLCPGIEQADFTTARLLHLIEHDHGRRLASARRSFAAVAADDGVSAALDCDPGLPLLHLEQVTYVAEGSPIEYSDVWIRGDALRISSFLRRT